MCLSLSHIQCVTAAIKACLKATSNVGKMRKQYAVKKKKKAGERKKYLMWSHDDDDDVRMGIEYRQRKNTSDLMTFRSDLCLCGITLISERINFQKKQASGSD